MSKTITLPETDRQGLIKKFEKSDNTIKVQFSDFFDLAKEWTEKAEGIKVTSIDQKKLMNDARDARLKLRNIRTSADKVRKGLKENILKQGKDIDEVYKIISEIISPIESHLQHQEEFEKRYKIEQLQILKEKRVLELKNYEFDGRLYPLDVMPDQQYYELLDTAKTSYEARQDKIKKQLEEEKLQEQKKQLQYARKERSAKYAFFIEGWETMDFTHMSEHEFDEVIDDAIVLQITKEKEQQRIKAEKDELEKQNKEKEKLLKVANTNKSQLQKKIKDQEVESNKQKEADKIKKQKEIAYQQSLTDLDKMNNVIQSIYKMDFPIVQDPELVKIVTNWKVKLTRVAKDMQLDISKYKGK